MSLCMGCMREIGDNVKCPSCGFDNSKGQHSPFLPYGTVLHGRYIVGSVIDTNGESSRYISFDKQTGDVVIVCEFLPMGLFERENDETNMRIRFENDDIFRKLMSDFISYFRTIAELKDFSALIRIHNIFQENNTAYVIEENQDLIPFEEYIERSNGHLDWDIARPLFMPVISALEAMHRRGLGHYAISPKNMYVTAYGKIKIAGFATANERKRGTPLKSQLYSGCAAPEQYENNFPIDSITEIYGISATLFYALTGNLPANAKERMKDSRLLMSTSTVKRLPPHVVTAIANGLQVKRENRITDFDDLRSQLSVSHTAQAIQEEISRTANMNVKKSDMNKNNGMSHRSVAFIASAITVIVLGVLGVLFVMQNPLQGAFTEGAVEESTAATEEWTGETIPNYVGMTYEEAVAAAEEVESITIYRDAEEVYSDQYAEDVIMEQSPKGGDKLTASGDISITVKVSKGVQMRELPSVKKKTVNSAAKALANQGFVVNAEYQYSDEIEEGRVISYRDYKSGDTLEDGSTVTIIVSKGSEETEAATSSYE
ncbi:MAG: PASTA domain-containing protein [Ruminococcus sp.]|nr:PASTA domain-containing protein [Ruminococcus sp.]